MMKINLNPNSVSKPVCSLCREIILETFFLQGMSGGQHQPLKVFARRVPPRNHPEKEDRKPPRPCTIFLTTKIANFTY